MAAPEIFIYYRVAALHEAVVGREVALFQRALCSRFAGLRARRLRRQPDADGNSTLMEIYAAVANDDPAASAELLAAIEQAARVIEPWLLGSRHLEVFEPCA